MFHDDDDDEEEEIEFLNGSAGNQHRHYGQTHAGMTKVNAGKKASTVPYHDVMQSDSEEEHGTLFGNGKAGNGAAGIVRYSKGKAQL